MIKRNHFVARETASSQDCGASGDSISEWHLLVYEGQTLSQGSLSQDVRDVLEQYPFTREISILAPNVQDQLVAEQVLNSTALSRANGLIGTTAKTLSVLSFDSGSFSISRKPIGNENDATQALSQDIQNAWLFDLFHRNRCLVPAPDGVHFGKTSGKHSDKFLRAANALVGSLECCLLGFFLLPAAAKLALQRIYVDTGPLVSVAFSLIEQCVNRKLWSTPPTIQSFSSYDGLDLLSRAPSDHLILISASTSGGLEQKILERTGELERIVTLFYIQGSNQPSAKSHLIANLTEQGNSLYGYPLVETYSNQAECKWCAQGLPAAEFEGDQFLLQKRKTQKINIGYHPTDETKCSLKSDAKNFLSIAKSQGLFSVLLAAGNSDGYRDIHIDKQKLVSKIPEFIAAFEKSLISGSVLKIPVDYLVTDDFSEQQLVGLKPFSSFSGRPFKQITQTGDIQTKQSISEGNSLVALSVIDSMHSPRKTSEILRSITPDGQTEYASIATLVESPEEFKQLSVALRTGAKGPNTFTFNPGYVLFLRHRFEGFSTWQRELSWLESIVEEDAINGRATPLEIGERLSFLKRESVVTTDLFWKAQNSEALKLQSDFVYLPVDHKESQADIYAIVTNLLSTAIQLNRDPSVNFSVDRIRQILRDTIYSEALIDPNNFLKFNDGILRAAILRASAPSELNYSRDLDLSGTMTGLIVHEITEWKFSRGQALLEFITAIAIKHLRLCGQHIGQIEKMIAQSDYLPPHVKRLGSTLKN